MHVSSAGLRGSKRWPEKRALSIVALRRGTPRTPGHQDACPSPSYYQPGDGWACTYDLLPKRDEETLEAVPEFQSPRVLEFQSSRRLGSTGKDNTVCDTIMAACLLVYLSARLHSTYFTTIPSMDLLLRELCNLSSFFPSLYPPITCSQRHEDRTLVLAAAAA